MSGKPSAPLRDRLRPLADYLPQIESPGFEFGHWHEAEEKEPGVYTMPYFADGLVSLSLIQTAYDDGWMRSDFNWVKWKNSREAIQLRDDPTALEQATPDQLAKLLTVLIRQDRFVEGALNGAFESGLLTGILRRAAVLAVDASSKPV